MNENSEQSAQHIAQRGREALIARLRPAFAEAVSAHADVLSLDDEQIEELVQRAADRADGLQWRRALASVATDELGIGLGEALSHPVVERAQAIARAPSYEESLAKLGLVTGVEAEDAASAPAAEAAPEPPSEAGAEPVAEAAPEPTEEELLAVTAAAEADPAAGEAVAGDSEEFPESPPQAVEDGELRLAATHLGGIATLQPGEQNLELRFGDAGLDIARRPGRVLGRLRWQEISALEVPSARGLRRRRRQERAQLMIRTEHGDATFEVPSVTEDELRESVTQLLEHYRPV